ncbi:hypothetical protein HDZ31DRAFT_61675 [Schizophyllum fasciatum]
MTGAEQLGIITAAALAAAIALAARSALPEIQALFHILLDQCPLQNGDSAKEFTAIIERLVCVTTSLVDAIPRPALTYFLTSVAPPLILFPILESSRPGAPVHRSRPAVALLSAHVLLLPLSLPLFALLFLARARRAPRPAALPQARAEAAVFGFLVGPAVLSGAMAALADPGVAAVWQFAGAVGAGAHYAHLAARRAPGAGYELVRGALLGVFMLSSSSHVALAADALDGPGAAAEAVLPSFGASLEERALDALRWTGLIGVGSTMLATLSFAANARQLLGIIGWHIIALPVAGPAAAITGTMLWRESLTQVEQAGTMSDDESEDTRPAETALVPASQKAGVKNLASS